MSNLAESELGLKKDFISKLKDRLIFSGWIAGLVIAFALVWILCRPLLSNCLMASVNKSLQGTRLSAPAQSAPGKPMPLGVWYSVENASDMVFVFAIMREGILIPCGAKINADGKVAELFPVSRHAQAVWNTVSPNIAGMYTRRIENAITGWNRN